MKIKRHTYAKPTPLAKDSNIALAAPSSHFRRENFDEALQYFVSSGYDVCFLESVFDREHYLAGSDQRRLDELRIHLSNPDVGAIFLLRGGFGSSRMFHLPLRKLPLSHPKIIMGMSDHTILLNEIARQHKMVTFHGPIVTSELFRSLSKLEKNELFRPLRKSKPVSLKTPQYKVLQAGNASGTLWGGNMSILQTTFGTPFQNLWKGNILFLEDNNEMEYRVDRIFAHFYLTGSFQRIAGLILGDFTDRENKPHSIEFLKRIVGRYVPKNIPVLIQLKSGHYHGKMLLPVGGNVAIQNHGKKILFEPFVS